MRKLTNVLMLVTAVACLAGEAPDLSSYQEVWVTPPKQPNPLLAHRTFRSASMEREVGYNLYLPPGYDGAGDRRYPVVYWLHGLGQNESADQYPIGILDGAIRSGALPPMIVVYASGGARTFYADSPDGKINAETAIVRELIPHIDSNFATINGREGRAIQGMSMGGFGALKLGLKYPQLFSSVVAFAPGLRSPESLAHMHPDIFRRMFGEDRDRYLKNEPFTLAREQADKFAQWPAIAIFLGDKETPERLERNRGFDSLLNELRFPHHYEEVPGVDHNLMKLAEHVKTRNFEFAARHFGK